MTEQRVNRRAARRRAGPAGRRGAVAPRGSMVDELIQRLTAEIADRRLLPGVRLEETGLAARFCVSRTPIREALRQLEIAGLVQRRPNRGVVVAAMPSEGLGALFETLVELEATCARLAAQRMSAGDRNQLLQAHLRTAEVALDHPDSGKGGLHRLIWAGAHNDELVALVGNLRQRLAPYRASRSPVDGRAGASFHEHAQVVEAIVAGHADEAAAAMRDHMRMAGETSWRFRY